MELSVVLLLVFVATTVLLALVIWSIRRHRDPRLHIDCDATVLI